jgi:acetolactate synthase regulatory subunit
VSASIFLWPDYRVDVSVRPRNETLPPCLRLAGRDRGVGVGEVTIFPNLETIERIENACAALRMEIAADEARKADGVMA